jgi:glycosyltransferase involved in cell wall biosynthesis/SAM-dependent methyltransferase
VNVCTIIAKNYLAHARVLAESFQRHHPDGRCFVLVIDEVDGYLDATAEPFTLVRPGEIGLSAFEEMRGAYDVMELSTAVKPWLLRHMLRHHDDSGVAYFDPDIQVISRMSELESLLREHAIVLTPHVLEGMPRDGRKPTETDILMAGVYNLGFIGLSDREDAHRMLDWWSERLLTDCHVAPERGLFVDQRWVDFVPGLVSDLAIFRHPGYNVAYWNLPERMLQRHDGAYSVNGRPLRFYHFSGYSPDRRTLLSRHQDRVDLTADLVLWELCDAYGDALVAAGYEEVRGLPYEHDVLPSGMRLTTTMRALYRAGVEVGECPESLFTSAGEADFVAWLNEPAPAAPALSRFLHGVWSGRKDLRRAYPGVEDGDVEGFVGWSVVYGREQIGIPDALLPAERLNGRGPSAAPAASVAEPAHEHEAAPQIDAGQPAAPAEPPFGVNVAGYLRSELGIGEVARQIVSALDDAAVPALPVGLLAPDSRQGHAYVTAEHARNPFPINIVCVNADGLLAFAREAGQRFFEDRYTIGVWWWETSEFPERFAGAFDHVDEVWVGSRFVAETLTAVSPVPVVQVPIPLRFAQPPPLRPGEHGWPDAFTYLFSWDYCSVFARKNPLAVVDAYTAAFEQDAGTALVLKCINPSFDPVGHRKVKEAIAGRGDIVLIDEYLDPADKDRLMRSCDCYVSLHRSEGLGLTMAEAMYHGKPVIATFYSGNADFMTPHNSYPIPFELVPIGEGADPYPPDGTWAEPDVAEAARAMRAVFDQPGDATRRAARAAHDIRARYSATAAGRVMRARLERVMTRLPAQPSAPLEERDLHELRRLLRRGGQPDRPSRFGKPGGALRRLVLRGMRPYTAYQRQVDEAIEEALSSLTAVQAGRAQRDLATAQAHATVLTQLRAQRTELEDLAARLANEHVARERGDEAPAQLVAETRALPYMAAEVFRVFDAGAAGAVLGYDDPSAGGEQDGYREFEDLFRGEEAFIADRQRRYLDVVGNCAPAVDVGCGRGEFLDVLAQAGIAATGVDADAGMVERCRAKGHAGTVHGDGVAYLKSREDVSLGLVFSAQVIEHMPPDVLEAFVAAAARKLRPGGLFVAETVNPHSVAAMKAFWVDITHQHPLFPEAMLALCRIAGFGSAYVFHPNGVGDIEADRFTTGEYAVVARR